MPTYQVSFRIFGPDLEPEQVTSTLGIEPEHTHRRGEPRTGKTGRVYGEHASGMWRIRSECAESGGLDEHIGDLATRLGASHDALARLREQGLGMDIFIGVFEEEVSPRAFGLSPEMVAAVEKLGCRLEFNVY